ncbi:unnamed protein product [Chrysoparadoxa australica]
MQQLLLALKPMEADYCEVIARQDSILTACFFIVKGRVEAYMSEEDPATRAADRSMALFRAAKGLEQISASLGTFLGVWGPKAFFGLDCLIQHNRVKCSYLASQTTALLWLDQADLIDLMHAYPAVAAVIEEKSFDSTTALEEVLESESISKDGVILKANILTDYKVTAIKQRLKHTEMGSLAVIATRQKDSGKHLLSVRGFSNIKKNSFGRQAGKYLKKRLSIKFSDGDRTTRLIRTWKKGNGGGFSAARDTAGRELQGVMEVEETPDELTKRGIMLPDLVSRQRWDILVMTMTIFMAIFTPVRVAFLDHTQSSGVIDVGIDIIQGMDMILRFRTAYEITTANTTRVWVTMPDAIGMNYLKGWLIIDVLSTIPFYLVSTPNSWSQVIGSLKLLRVLHLKELGKLMRRLTESAAAGRSCVKLNPRLMQLLGGVPRWVWDLLQVFATIYYCAHIFGCVWWATSRYNEGDSWWAADGLTTGELRSLYLASVYWALTTITTVGYGDISPTNDYERWIACITMVCGTTMFSYIIGSVSQMARNPTGGNVLRNERLQEVSHYLEENMVQGHIREKIKAHMSYLLGWKSAYGEASIMSRTPPELRCEVMLNIHADCIAGIAIFKGQDLSFITAILQHLRPQLYSQGEHVYESSRLSQGVYFVMKGIAESFSMQTTVDGSLEAKVLAILPAGKLFGATRFLLSSREGDVAVQAFTDLQLYLLSNNSIAYMVRSNPLLASVLQEAMEEAIFDQAQEEMGSNPDGDRHGVDGQNLFYTLKEQVIEARKKTSTGEMPHEKIIRQSKGTFCVAHRKRKSTAPDTRCQDAALAASVLQQRELEGTPEVSPQATPHAGVAVFQGAITGIQEDVDACESMPEVPTLVISTRVGPLGDLPSDKLVAKPRDAT